MIEHFTKVKNILMIPKAYLRDKKHNTKVVRDIVLFPMMGAHIPCTTHVSVEGLKKTERKNPTSALLRRAVRKVIP